MTKIVVIGAGLAGMSAAYELRATLASNHDITVIGGGEQFSFTPSNPWVGIGWRKAEDVCLPAAQYLAKKNIQFIPHAVAQIIADKKQLTTSTGQTIEYDYLIICTGPKLAFEEIKGLGPEPGFTQSICTTAHAAKAWLAYEAFLKNPGAIVIGAAQMASCFGPAYEFAMMIDADLRKRKLRDRVPMTFVTSEPYIGHMGLALAIQKD
jgi:sulfide:quinone oxidoreductase